MRRFFQAVELPICLRALGMPEPTGVQIVAIAAATMTAPHARDFQRVLGASNIADAVRRIEALPAIDH
ncbi:MAG: hypothetical protein IT532_10080 [Burkholderiales bacterium]|nr:hypothetical protein [Burkholderiales bacterium]